MKFRNSWIWLLLALVLLVLTFFHQQFGTKPKVGPTHLLPKLEAGKVTSVNVRPKGQLEIRAYRTNGDWALSQPLNYPAQSLSVEKLIPFLQQLIPAASIASTELKDRMSADEEYGFTHPQWSITLSQTNLNLPKVLIGKTTPPGDQLYLQVVGF